MLLEMLVGLIARILFALIEPVLHRCGFNNLPLQAFSWEKVPPVEHLVWHECFHDFKCARLRVPLDWQANSSETQGNVDIAVIKLEASVSILDPSYGGIVVLNPGGPGGSGVQQLLRSGSHVRSILSPTSKTTLDPVKHFDILSFDPRGVNNTRPNMYCFPNRQEAALFERTSDAYEFANTSDKEFESAWVAQRAVADSCSHRPENVMLASHVNTAPVARDIIEIIEQHGRWRERESKRLLRNGKYSLQERHKILSRNKWRPNREKLQYWGFSYGTVLGATFAAMYPDRVHRMILDGVVDATDYMAGTWLTNVRDTDRLIPAFANHCYAGGREGCALFREEGPETISALIEQIINNVRSHPIGFPATPTHGPGIITDADLMLYFRRALYTPLQKWPEVARIFHELSIGNASTLAAIRHAQMSPITRPLLPACTPDKSYTLPCYDTESPSLGLRDTTPIACSDGPRADKQTQQEFKRYAENLISRSKVMGAAWVGHRIPCTAWHAKASWRYEGNFQTSMPQPLLLISTSIDPVTPLHSAMTMSAKFNGSAVLEIEGEGHCSAATISMCAGRAIREYFQHGKVPEPKGKSVRTNGTFRSFRDTVAICKADRRPFDGYLPDGPEPDVPQGESDAELWTALVGLARS